MSNSNASQSKPLIDNRQQWAAFVGPQIPPHCHNDDYKLRPSQWNSWLSDMLQSRVKHGTNSSTTTFLIRHAQCPIRRHTKSKPLTLTFTMGCMHSWDPKFPHIATTMNIISNEASNFLMMERNVTIRNVTNPRHSKGAERRAPNSSKSTYNSIRNGIT